MFTFIKLAGKNIETKYTSSCGDTVKHLHLRSQLNGHCDIDIALEPGRKLSMSSGGVQIHL